MELRVETEAWDDLSVVILPSEITVRTTEGAGRTLTGRRIATGPFPGPVASTSFNIASTETDRLRLQAYEPALGFHPHGIADQMVQHFGGADGGEGVLR